MQKQPNKLTFFKSHKIKSYKGQKAKKLSFFKSGLKTKNYCYISFKNFEAFRRVYVRAFRSKEIKNKKNFKLIQSSKKKKKKKNLKSKQKRNQLIFKSHFFSPLTKKPLQVRMGKGKGSVYDWVFPCGDQRILIEQSTSVRKKKIERVFKKAKKKMPTSFKYVVDKRKQLFPNRIKNFLFSRKLYIGVSENEAEFGSRNSILKLKKTNE